MPANLVMDLTTLGRTRIEQMTTDGLVFSITHVAYGSGGYDVGTPTNALALNAAATALSTEVYRKTVPAHHTTVDTVAYPKGKETTYTSVTGTEFNATVGEAGLFATILNAGSTGLSVGSLFLIAHAHFPRVIFNQHCRIAHRWPIDFGGGELPAGLTYDTSTVTYDDPAVLYNG